MFKRHYISILENRINDKKSLIQVISGPRQIGKTTLVQQFLESVSISSIYESADAVIGNQDQWISSIWSRARGKLKSSSSKVLVLCLDEVQKIPNWSEHVKKEWDTDIRENTDIRVILLGSSRLLLMEGLTESLAGRFESISMSHWTFREMKIAFGFSPEEFVWFGGYPGAAELRNDEDRWRSYVRDSLIETAISKDIFLMSRINKPALLKRYFELAAYYSGQIVSYTKLLGQLQDAGNTVTLAHYLDLIEMAGLISGLDKYGTQKVRQRASSPKFQVHNPAISSIYSTYKYEQIINQPEEWGRFVESAVGAHLLAHASEGNYKLFYWREKHLEVDFILQQGERIIAIEVKSGKQKSSKGMEGFTRSFKPFKAITIGSNSYPWEEFISNDPEDLFL